MLNGFHNPHQHTQCNNYDTMTVMIEHKSTFQYATTTSFFGCACGCSKSWYAFEQSVHTHDWQCICWLQMSLRPNYWLIELNQMCVNCAKPQNDVHDQH